MASRGGKEQGKRPAGPSALWTVRGPAWSLGAIAKMWALSWVITSREQLRLCINAAFH